MNMVPVDALERNQMRKLRANIQKDNVEILSNIEILLTELTDPRSGLKSWSGTFTLTTGKYLEPGDACRLLLEDGRSGDFLVTNINIGTGHPDVVRFQVSGDLK